LTSKLNSGYSPPKIEYGTSSLSLIAAGAFKPC
jgi:hypothetical protein